MAQTRDGKGGGNNDQRGEAQGTLDELQKQLAEFDTAMLSTITPEGMIRARPMAMQDHKDLSDCDLWFVTSDNTPKVDEISRDNQVGVVCYRPRDRAYVSVSATARFERNPAEIERLWKPDWKAWFPEGPKSGDITVVKLTVHRAEYWEPEGGRLRVLYSMLKNTLKGESATKDLNPPKHLQK